jgi:SAM-dependent methyltransferase
MKEMWNARYQAEEYAYGKPPNIYFKSSLEKYHPEGRILLPAEGEGRNAVFAAKIGLEAIAFDISEEGKKKALQLAKAENVEIQYEVGDFLKMNFSPNSFDVAGLIYAHFPPHILAPYHQKISTLIKPNGFIILEGFSKNNLPLRKANPEVGGPDKEEMLFSKESIQKDFSDFDVLELEETEVDLHEGLYHNGIAKVIRFVGKKRN